MLFDLTGRRKHVVRFVYAILALLMGASLFLTVGPVNITELIGNSSSSSSNEVLHERAENIEAKLARSPKDEALLLALVRARMLAALSETEVNPELGTSLYSAEGRQDALLGGEAWERYLKQAKEANPSAALLVAKSYFALAESSGQIGEIEELIEKGTKTQRIAAEAQPTINSLTTLAGFQYYNGEFEAGDKTAKKAMAAAPSKEQARQVKAQTTETRKRAKEFQKQKKKFKKLEAQKGKEALENPFGGLGGSAQTVP